MSKTNKLFTETQYELLIKNGSDTNPSKDYPPVANLFMTGTACTWLISELDPEHPHIAFGLCDLGMGFPELGYVSLTEVLEAEMPSRRLRVDQDFEGKFPLTVYSKTARAYGCIIDDEPIVKKFLDKPQP